MPSNDTFDLDNEPLTPKDEPLIFGDLSETHPMDTVAWAQEVSYDKQFYRSNPVDEMVRLPSTVLLAIGAGAEFGKQESPKLNIVGKAVCLIAGFFFGFFAMAVIWLVLRNRPSYKSCMRYCYKGLGIVALCLLALMVFSAIYVLITGNTTIRLAF
jgi:hypothetical protein